MTVANYVSQDFASRSDKLPKRGGPNYRGIIPYSRRYYRLERQAERYKALWRTLNEYMHPWSGRYLFGDKDRDEIFSGFGIRNSAVGDAARTCASGLHGGLTSPSKPWFEVTHPDSEIMEEQEVKDWMHAVQEIMRSVLAKSNFYDVMPNLYMEAIIYGTAAAIIDPDTETGIRLRQLTIGEYYLGLGEDLRVNSLYRRLEMTPGQMLEKFGKNNKGFTRAVTDAIEQGNLDEPTITVIHAMQPIGMFGGKTSRLFNYESVYFIQDKHSEREREILLWQGHRSRPFVAVRWATTSDDVYGYSPGMMALPDDRMLQGMERDYINAVELGINPPLTGPTELDQYMHEGLRPGDFIPYNAATKDQGLRSIFQLQFDFNNTRAKIQETVAQIQNKFYNHLFLSILFNTKQMTAAEVTQRLEEKSMVLGPVLERFQSELFDPILDRLFVIMFHEYGMIPPPPEQIAGGNLKIDYIGSLAQSVKMQGLTNITNTLPVIAELLNLDPAAVVKMNVKELIDYVSTVGNFPPNAIRSDEECEEIEGAQAQAQQQQMQMQQMATMADAAKKASETSLQNGSLLTGTEGGMEGAGFGIG